MDALLRQRALCCTICELRIYFELIFRPELKPVEKELEVILKFPDVEVLNPPVMTMDEVAFRYAITTPVIFSGVNIGANSESRICIVGENGAGKTTLLKVSHSVDGMTRSDIY